MVIMPKGGHAHSGPPKQAGSRTSERAGFMLTALPNEGFTGDAPDLSTYMPLWSDRHEAVWLELWATPQACAWAMERWRWPVVADLTRRMVQSEDPEQPIAVATAIRQLRDDLGLSAAGLRQHGWAIAPVEVGSQTTNESPSDEVSQKRQRRLRDAQ